MALLDQMAVPVVSMLALFPVGHLGQPTQVEPVALLVQQIQLTG